MSAGQPKPFTVKVWDGSKEVDREVLCVDPLTKTPTNFASDSISVVGGPIQDTPTSNSYAYGDFVVVTNDTTNPVNTLLNDASGVGSWNLVPDHRVLRITLGIQTLCPAIDGGDMVFSYNGVDIFEEENTSGSGRDYMLQIMIREDRANNKFDYSVFGNTQTLVGSRTSSNHNGLEIKTVKYDTQDPNPFIVKYFIFAKELI